MSHFVACRSLSLCVFFLLAASPCVLGDDVAEGIYIVQLDKQYVPVMRQNVTVAHKTTYFGTIYIGFPHQQNFTVVFDTGSAHILVPSVACRATTCQNHRQYDYRKSASALPINNDGSPATSRQEQIQITYGTGEVQGPFVYDTVCLHKAISGVAAPSCVRARVIHAKKMSESPFSQFAFDGVVGLGFPDLAVHPEFNFFGQMVQHSNHLLSPRFGIFLSRDDAVPSEISFGGPDVRRVASELKHVPVVHREAGYWQIAIKSVRVGTERLALCDSGDCIAIMDSGTSMLGVPKHSAPALRALLSRDVPHNPAQLDCREWPGPDFAFDLGDGFEVFVTAEDYSRPAPLDASNSTDSTSNVICGASLLPVHVGPPMGDNVFIFGEPLLRKYYTTYDIENARVGFADAVQPTELPSSEPATHSVYGAPSDFLPVPSEA